MKKIYLDYAATTPVDPRVLASMMPYFSKKFANTMSLHEMGQIAGEAVENSRKIIASYINAKTEEIYFTSSATESNNLALKGVPFGSCEKEKNHIIISSIEHDCVLESSRWLQRQGFKVDELDVDKDGFVDINQLKKLINKSTVLVSVIHGNNEIGTVQDIETIGKICRENGVYFHTDASQSLGKVEIDVEKMNIDLLTASSHKIYGPKGAAILYVKKGVIIEPIIHGGGHEKGLRSSTSNVPAIVGMGKAIEILQKEGKKENNRLEKLRDLLIKEILENIKGTHLNGPINRLSNNANISFPSIEGESLLMELDFEGVEVSTGSACSSRNLMPSHVLMALGAKPQTAHGSIRLSVGRFTTEEEITKAIKIFVKVVNKLKQYSPFKI